MSKLININLTTEEYITLKRILMWQIADGFGCLDVETDEKAREYAKQTMRVSKKILLKLGVNWSVVRKYLLKNSSIKKKEWKIVENAVKGVA